MIPEYREPCRRARRRGTGDRQLDGSCFQILARALGSLPVDSLAAQPDSLTVDVEEYEELTPDWKTNVAVD